MVNELQDKESKEKKRKSSGILLFKLKTRITKGKQEHALEDMEIKWKT